MNWEDHPLLPNAIMALTDRYSFIVTKETDGYYTSWQDRYKGGSASSTIEGPFKSSYAAETNCENTLQNQKGKTNAKP